MGMNTKFRRRLLASTLFVGAAALTTPALAQQNPPVQPSQVGEPVVGDPAEAVDDSEATQSRNEIVVTGSRIARPNLTANSPIAVVTGEQAVEQGDITLDTFLNTLPQVNPAGTSTSNNPGNNGQSNINLRGLGTNRNLILINGRRPMVSDDDQTVDVNTIPQGLIERIEVVTGGAGAAYGADAIAGVVNFILKDDFEGIDLRASYSNSIPETDAREYQISGTIGGNFADGRGNMALSVEYSDRQGLIKAQRPFATQASSTTGTPPVGRLIENNAIPQAAINALFAKYGVPAAQYPLSGLSQLHFNSNGTLFGSGTFNNPLDVSNYKYDPNGADAAAANQKFYPDFYSYNFDAINLLVLPLERKSAFLRGHYEISKHFDVFVQGGYTEYNSTSALAPTPIGTRIYAASTPGGPTFATSPLITPGTGFVTNSVIPVTNPFIPADLRTLLEARVGNDPLLVGSGATEPFRFAIRTLGAGLRENSFTNEVLQGLVGLRGEIVEGWNYETYYSWGRTTIDRTATGNINVQKLQQLLEAPDGGASLCTGGYNPFGIQPVSSSCVEFLDETGSTKQRFTQKIGQAFVTGELAELPAGTLSAVLGVESRRFRYSFDPGILSGPIAGFNTQTPDLGTNKFFDIFGELLVPILRDQPWARTLELSLGYRSSKSDFNDIIRGIDGKPTTSDAYKAELSWAPVDALRFRATYQRSVRAPNFGELFAGGASFVAAFDPCSVSTNFRQSGGTAARDLCIRNGVGGGNLTGAITPAQITAAGAFVATPGAQVNTNFAGNANLKPEKSDTFTVGAVFQAMGFTGSLDYYKIKIDDKIFGPDTNLLIAACYGYQGTFNTALDPNSPYCKSVGRSGSNLSSITVQPEVGGNPQGFFTQINQGIVDTSGIDFQLGYRLPMEMLGEGSALSLNLLVNYLLEFRVEELPGVVLDYAGTASYFGQGLGTSFPEWKGTLNAALNLNPITLSTRVRYIDAMRNRASVQFPGETSFTGPGSVWYFDFAAEANIENMTFRIGVNNAFDRQPEEYAPNVQSGTDPSLYDVIGRRAYVQARLRF
jgi:outer membrane receptor protein involved in Fe transport